jgi:hypothetical protein
MSTKADELREQEKREYILNAEPACDWRWHRRGVHLWGSQCDLVFVWSHDIGEHAYIKKFSDVYCDDNVKKLSWYRFYVDEGSELFKEMEDDSRFDFDEDDSGWFMHAGSLEELQDAIALAKEVA